MKNNLKRIPNHRIVMKFNQPTKASGRIYPDSVVNIDEDKDYLVSFFAPKGPVSLLSDVCASAKLGKTKDCLYLKKVEFFTDEKGKLLKQEDKRTIVDSIKSGMKFTTAGSGTINPETKTVNSDFNLFGLFLTEDKV